MKNLMKKISPRMGIVIGLALLLILSLTLHTTGGEAKYRSQAVVSGTIHYTQPQPQTAPEPEVTEPEVTEPEVTEPEVTEPEVTEPEVTESETTEPEAGEESTQP
ncbi:MAG: hypothetical protein II458_06670 [Oscillospiraceae bacterium]|nr:hypothetical protein [Oscillospiraceae bacterium]